MFIPAGTFISHSRVLGQMVKKEQNYFHVFIVRPLRRYQKIIYLRSMGYKNLLNFTCNTMKFHCCEYACVKLLVRNILKPILIYLILTIRTWTFFPNFFNIVNSLFVYLQTRFMVKSCLTHITSESLFFS